jgi:transposase
VHISTQRTSRVTLGDLSNYTNLYDEPADHPLGRSRGGMTCKDHALVDAHGLPLVVLTGPGQAGDSPMLNPLLDHLRVARPGRGRPRTRPEALLADKAYCGRAHRQALQQRGITAVIPDRDDQIVNHNNKGSAVAVRFPWTKKPTRAATSLSGSSTASSSGGQSQPATTNSP